MPTPNRIDDKNNPGSKPSPSPVGKMALWGLAKGYSAANSGPDKKMTSVAGKKLRSVDMAKAAANRLRGKM